MSSSGAVVSTRAGCVTPSCRRIVTDMFPPTTCTLVRIVSGLTKNPDPEPSVVSTRTTAGNAAPMTSSSDAAGPAAGVGAGTGGAASGTRTVGERGGAAGVGDGALGSTVSTAAGRAGCDTTGMATAAGLTGPRP